MYIAVLPTSLPNAEVSDDLLSSIESSFLIWYPRHYSWPVIRATDTALKISQPMQIVHLTEYSVVLRYLTSESPNAGCRRPEPKESIATLLLGANQH